MIDKNLIVHFGVNDQKFGHRLDISNDLLERNENMSIDKEAIYKVLYKLCNNETVLLWMDNYPPIKVIPTRDAYLMDYSYRIDNYPRVTIYLDRISFDEMILLLFIFGNKEKAVQLCGWNYVPFKYFSEVSNLKEATKILNLTTITVNSFTGWKKNEEKTMNKIEQHKDICNELTNMYEKKNSDYGNSYAELRKDYPNSICIRLSDKLNRLKSLYDNNETHKIAESAEDTLKDIANYAIMELIERGYQPEKEPEYKNRLRIEYNGDEGLLYFEFWDKNGKKTEDEWFSICDDHPWNEKVFELAKDVNKFLENMYWDEDEDECYIDPGPLSHEALQIARDLLYYEHSLFYDFSEFENRGAADLLNP